MATANLKRKPLRGPYSSPATSGYPSRCSLVGPRSLHSADHGPVGAEDFAAQPASSEEHELDDPDGGADDDDPVSLWWWVYQFCGRCFRPDRLEHFEEFLVAFTFLFCDWIDFVS